MFHLAQRCDAELWAYEFFVGGSAGYKFTYVVGQLYLWNTEDAG